MELTILCKKKHKKKQKTILCTKPSKFAIIEKNTEENSTQDY